MNLKIGITDTETRYQNYPAWIKGEDSEIEIIRLTYSNTADLKNCDGILLSGGIDTHPKFYKNKRTDYPLAPPEFNVARDEFEINVFLDTICQELPNPRKCADGIVESRDLLHVNDLSLLALPTRGLIVALTGAPSRVRVEQRVRLPSP